MDLNELMQFARNYSKLGWAIQEQVDDILKGGLSDINPTALTEINDRLIGFNDELDEIINDAMEEIKVTQ